MYMINNKYYYLKKIKDKKKNLDLLLLADPEEEAIDKYIDNCEVFEFYHRDILIGQGAVMELSSTVYEIKNFAIYEKFHNCGYGKILINLLCEKYLENFKNRYIIVGTSEQGVGFYQKCGFQFSYIVENFFINNYKQPIFENGIQSKDMFYLKFKEVNMENFAYYTPTKVVFGKDEEKNVGKLAKDFGAKKVLIHYGGGSAVRSGLIDRIKTSLTEENIAFIELGGVKPNPRLSLIYEGIKLAKENGVDFILAVGGGSVIDSAKGIGYGVANPDIEDVWDLYIGKKKTQKCAPIGVVLTIAAAGSEMSGGSVVTKEDEQLKRSYGCDNARPKFAIMNPELTYTLPKYQIACGVVDIMMHTMERYFSPVGNLELTDKIAEGLLKTMIKYGKLSLENPTNYEARAEIMWASSLAHNGLTGCGGIGDWSTHQLEHDLGGVYDIAHGAGLAAVWGSWARYVYKENPRRFAQFAENVFGIEKIGTDEEVAIKGIEAMENFYKDIEMPISISETGITLSEKDIEMLAEKCSNNGTRYIGSFKKLFKEDMAKIYSMAK
ncbi:iron-containing alcohol dehydrogenase [uncultured Fusobacterium sp.]|jgi:alcohol dehydrogenase YqhD (iron-dependent ADH family)/ribosomal protein S18 acetylase RimI-like enzyme|uniref:iron-containing alcohol dehydrogenase n=1 Tax=uncultured Fusobacterium sp. TaxID=159267 RepID=UPI0015A61BE3|nr:iron-containing alcohol dehydrogenase [uncultured Fusobacterium sp.]